MYEHSLGPLSSSFFCLSPAPLGTEFFCGGGGTLKGECIALAKFLLSFPSFSTSTSLLSLFSIPANPAAEPRLSKLIVLHPPGLRVGDRSRDGGAAGEKSVRRVMKVAAFL